MTGTAVTVVELADRAASGGGLQLYLALDTVAGLPLAASLLVSASAPGTPALPVPETLTAEVLLGAMRRPGTKLDVVDLPAGQAVRRRVLRRTTPADVLGPVARAEPRDHRAFPDAERGTERPPVLGVTMLDYALPVPGSARVMFLSFSSPLEVLADALVELFDAIAGTLRWKD